MSTQIQPIREWDNVTREMFENDIRPLRQPAVIRNARPDWPIVQRGRQSSAAVVDYLTQFYSGKPIGTLATPASEKGRIFYNKEINGYNFNRTMQDLRVVLAKLLELENQPDPPALAMQAVIAPEFLPGFEAENPMPLTPEVEAKLWIGNAAVVAPHYDILENVACVAVGRRRFTLFPPEQLPNLYVGPLENTPAGAPISMVDVRAPDFDIYPRFREALAAAQSAELGPGDAIYIPYMWWHGVEALDHFNILVNYWWMDYPDRSKVHPRTALAVARLAFGDMTAEAKQRWRLMFDHYVFGGGDEHPMAHVPEHARGMFSNFDEPQMKGLRQLLARLLNEA
ncbi:MAG: cupin-like domain-containing protein [Sphingomicrobium sp.]